MSLSERFLWGQSEPHRRWDAAHCRHIVVVLVVSEIIYRGLGFKLHSFGQSQLSRTNLSNGQRQPSSTLSYWRVDAGHVWSGFVPSSTYCNHVHFDAVAVSLPHVWQRINLAHTPIFCIKRGFLESWGSHDPSPPPGYAYGRLGYSIHESERNEWIMSCPKLTAQCQIRPLSDTVPEVVSVHLFTLATMVVCFAAACKHNNRKDKCRFFGFRVIQRNTRSWKTLHIKF